MNVGVNPFLLIKAILNFDLRKLLFRLIALDRVDFLQVFVVFENVGVNKVQIGLFNFDFR